MINSHDINYFRRDIAEPQKQDKSPFCCFKKLIPLALGAFFISKRSGNHYIPLKASRSEDNFILPTINAAKNQSAHQLTPLCQNTASKIFFPKEDEYSVDVKHQFDDFIKERFQFEVFINERFPVKKVDDFGKNFISKDIELNYVNTHTSPTHPHVKIVVSSSSDYSDPSIEESKNRVINAEKLALHTFKFNLTKLLKPSTSKKGKIRAPAIKKSDIAKIFGIRMSVVAADNFPENLRFEDIYKEVWQNDHAIFPRLLHMNSDKKENGKAEWGALNYAIQKYGCSVSFKNNDASYF